MPRDYKMLPNIYVKIEEDLFEIIQNEIPRMEEALGMLHHSLKRCEVIEPGEKHSLIELEKLEALIARFVRVSGMFIESFLPLVDKIDKESEGTIVDQMHRAVKKGVVDKFETVNAIRNLRADILKADLPAAVDDYFDPIYDYSPHLENYLEGFRTYAKSRSFYLEPDKLKLDR